MAKLLAFSFKYREKKSAVQKANWRDSDFVDRVYIGIKRAGRNKLDAYCGFDTAKKLIHQRDKRVCQLCGATPDKIDIHHINVDTNDQHWANLISLCDSCHDGEVHTTYRNGNRAEMQLQLQRKAELLSIKMPRSWLDDYDALIARLNVEAI